MSHEMQVTVPPNRIRELRRARGLFARHLAVMLDVGEPQVTRYETGETALPLLKAKALAEFFDVTVEHLLGWDREPAGDEAA